MSTKKNISGGSRYVPLLDREVADGEVVEVPDVQGDGVSPVVWPETTWADVKAKTSTKDDSAGTTKKADS